MVKKTLYSFLIIALISLFMPFYNTFADWKDDGACNLNPDVAMCHPQETAPNLAVMLIDIIIGVLGVVAVAFIIISGYRYTTAQGQPEVVAKARRGLIFSVVGLIVAILAFAIINFITSSIST